MVVEIFSFHDGIRVIDKAEYSSIDEWEKDLFILKLRGTHVGYRRYDNINMAQFNELTQTQKNNTGKEYHIYLSKSEFDKEAYINKGATPPRSPYI
jgi:hypothetical protein